jgi:hypothetical protein
MKTAVERATQAKQRFEQGDVATAERLLLEALALYPESPEMQDALASVQAAAAFQSKDYARFRAVAEEAVVRRPHSSPMLGLLASALATQYAASGDETYRTRALEVLEQARQEAERSPPTKALYDEYSVRVRHRLDTREIIDRAEYDRRFRGAAAPSSPTRAHR